MTTKNRKWTRWIFPVFFSALTAMYLTIGTHQDIIAMSAREDGTGNVLLKQIMAWCMSLCCFLLTMMFLPSEGMYEEDSK